MTTRRTTTTTAPRRVKLAIGLIFGALLAVSLSLGLPSAATTPAATSYVTASTSRAATTAHTTSKVTTASKATTTFVPRALADGDSTTTSCTPVAVTPNVAGLNASIDSSAALPSNYTTCSSATTLNQLLPINRWGSSATTMSVGPAGVNLLASASTDTLSNIASILFSMSAFVWSLIYDVLQFALTHNIVQDAAQVINNGYNVIASAIWDSGLIWFLIFFVLASLGWGLIRGGSKVRVIGTILALVIPLAALQSFANLSGGGTAFSSSLGCAASTSSSHCPTVTQNTSSSYVAPTGSPAWFAIEGMSLADAAAAGIATTVAKVEPALGSQLTSSTASDPASCEAYVEVLNADYAALVSAQGDNANDPENLAAQTLPAISALWESGYLANWIGAEFSSSPDSEDLYCHYLEDDIASNISATEQQQLNEQAYGAALGTNATLLPTFSIDPTNLSTAENALLYGYAACTYTGGKWVLKDDWADLIAGGTNNGTWKNVCSYWPTVAHYIDNPQNGTSNTKSYASMGGGGAGSDLNWATDSDYEGDYANATNQAGASAAFNTVNTFMGNGAGASRILAGLTSLVTALAYGWALLGLGLGSIIAQMGLIAMMILLPGTLVLLAVPRKRGSGMPNTGSKLLRMTMGFFACRLIVTVVLTVLIYLTLTLSSILAAAH